jgi:RimJ/RimL family protein N-acetyltransferase
VSISELAELHLETMYELDADGRVLACTSPEVPPPRFHMLRTGEGNSWLLRHDLPAEIASELEQALAGVPVIADFERTPPNFALVRNVLARHAPLAREYRGPAFAFPDALPHVEAETIAQPDDPRFQGAFAWVRAAGVREQPIVAQFADGVAVAVCHSARSRARAAEAGLETDPSHRRQGHATAVTATWAAAVRSEGRVPLYSTWWENGASLAVARRLGLVLYGEDWHID